MDEREALQRCRQGNRNAFGVLVEQYQRRVLALCLRMTGNQEDGADLAQQAFVQAYRHLDSFDSDQPFGPWLFRIATNECIAFLRRKRHETVNDEAALEQAGDPEPGAPVLLELAEDREQVRKAVSNLPPAYRTPIVLHYFQNLSYQEIAAQTGMPIGTVATQLYRAKQQLKRLLTEQGVITVAAH